MNEQIVVVSDIHGQAKLLERVVDRYGDDVSYILNGDMIDRGPDSRGILDVAADIDASIILGNHEWVLLGALNEEDPERREVWQEKWLKPGKMRYENKMLQSYGIEQGLQLSETAEALKVTMQELGHLSLLESADIYIETPDMLVIHTGLAHWKSWQSQKHEADTLNETARAGTFLDEELILDEAFDYANEWRTPYDLKKPLISGHSHFRTTARDRTYSPHGRLTRVRLASNLTAGDPLYVYESWSGQIAAFEQLT